MSTADLVVKAVEDCCRGVLGSVRTSPSSVRGAYAGIDDLTLAENARTNFGTSKPTIEVEVLGTRATVAVGPTTGDRVVKEYSLNLVVVLPTSSEIEADQRRNTRALGVDLFHQYRAALTFPGNLATVDGSPTGIVSGCASSCGPMRVTREDFKKRIYRLEAPVRVLALESQAVS